MQVSIEDFQTELKFGNKGPLIRIRDEQGKTSASYGSAKPTSDGRRATSQRRTQRACP